VASIFSICKSRFLRSSVAATLTAGILWVLALAASPQLHEALHHDADEPDHDCAVTLFLHGACDGTSAVQMVPVFLPARPSPLAEMCSQEVAALFLLTSVLEHAPPLFS
jgi:hypothetical protein